MTDLLSIYCLNTGRYVEVAGGESLFDVAARLGSELPFAPVMARVNNKSEGLGYRIYSPKQVEFLSVTSPASQRAYIRSLCMLLYKAVSELLPAAKLRIEHSISRGYYCLLTGVEVTPEVVASLRDRMHTLVAEDHPFKRHEKLTKDVCEIFERQGLDDKVMLLKSLHELYAVYYTLDGLADYYYGCLMPSTGCLKVFDLVPYRDGMLLMGFDPARPDEAPAPLAQPKMFDAYKLYLQFNHIIGVRNVGELNRCVTKGTVRSVINVAEALHEKRLATISDSIRDAYHNGGARIVLIEGPSSSGKTTFTKRLSIQLITNLLQPVMISLDDYFVDRAHTPVDEDGELDYESLYALDIKQFNADLNALLRGETVELPSYNFTTGMREYKGNRINLTDNSILLIEGIHGLNPELTASVEERMKFRIFVSALTTISLDDHNWVPTTDNRLLRRIIRDFKYRGTSATDTIKRWPSVRRGEEKWIFPHQENADATFNSSLLFELGVMRKRGEEILSRVPRDIPEYAEAYRLRKFLSYFLEISEDYLPSTSLLREFLGGSSFKY